MIVSLTSSFLLVAMHLIPNSDALDTTSFLLLVAVLLSIVPFNLERSVMRSVGCTLFMYRRRRPRNPHLFSWTTTHPEHPQLPCQDCT